MSFNGGVQSDPSQVGAGEKYGDDNTIISESTFEDQLVIGRFAKIDSGSIDNIDASVDPSIAGVVLRNITNPIEDGGVIDSALFDKVDILRAGLVSVDVVTGDVPAKYGAVFVNNQATADAGKATTTDDANTEPSNAEFIEEIQTSVWMVRLI